MDEYEVLSEIKLGVLLKVTRNGEPVSDPASKQFNVRVLRDGERVVCAVTIEEGGDVLTLSSGDSFTVEWVLDLVNPDVN